MEQFSEAEVPVRKRLFLLDTTRPSLPTGAYLWKRGGAVVAQATMPQAPGDNQRQLAWWSCCPKRCHQCGLLFTWPALVPLSASALASVPPTWPPPGKGSLETDAQTLKRRLPGPTPHPV